MSEQALQWVERKLGPDGQRGPKRKTAEYVAVKMVFDRGITDLYELSENTGLEPGRVDRICYALGLKRTIRENKPGRISKKEVNIPRAEMVISGMVLKGCSVSEVCMKCRSCRNWRFCQSTPRRVDFCVQSAQDAVVVSCTGSGSSRPSVVHGGSGETRSVLLLSL